MVKAASVNWYSRAVKAADRIDEVHTSPWKLASTYALLSIAESLLTPGATASSPDRYDEILTTAEVSAITKIPAGTLRYFRYAGTGPQSFRLGRQVKYRRADVEKWLDEARRRG
ncbi:AlpA family transcriptional regulator [Mycobacterium sp. 1165196.3]|uniref:helix-turn-helix transcriptional regulator n=1 Tax=Mycobacterium sp. 1165196.3 TaxID=1834071 RepID=UPI0009ED3FEF|nr:helix-turn-helix domain-containing protein [Mycobacterium sp. 1165196.3]